MALAFFVSAKEKGKMALDRSPMNILLTNDDGITAPGLVAMYRELNSLGRVEVVAPETVQSATSHGITLNTPLLTSRATVEQLFTGTAVEGRPADCVKLAVSQLLAKPPDLVVSGINSGANVGINVIYSGTVAAAIEAAFLGLPAIAISLYIKTGFPIDYSRTAWFARHVIDLILGAGLTPGQAVSVNIPSMDPGQSPRGIKVVRQCIRPWVDTYERRQDPKGNDYFWNTSIFRLATTDDDSDVAALRDDYITVTPLQFDLTSYATLSNWAKRSWALGPNRPAAVP